MARKRFGAARLPCPAVPLFHGQKWQKHGDKCATPRNRHSFATLRSRFGAAIILLRKNNIKRLTPAGFHDNGKKKPKNRQSSDMQVTIQDKLPKGGCAGFFCPGAVRWRDHGAMTLGVRVIDPPRPMHGQARLR